MTEYYVSAREKLLLVFQKYPEREFYIRDLCERVQVSTVRVRQVLTKLEKAKKIERVESKKTWRELQALGVIYPGSTKWCWKLTPNDELKEGG